MKYLTILLLGLTTYVNASNLYTVQFGDTFYGIALRNNLSYSQLQKLNPSINPNHLLAGTKLKVDDKKVDLSNKVVQIDGKKYVLKPSK